MFIYVYMYIHAIHIKKSVAPWTRLLVVESDFADERASRRCCFYFILSF